MSLFRIRNSIKTWVEKYISIESWSIDVPNNVPRVLTITTGAPPTPQQKLFPANCAIAMPVQDFKLYKEDGQAIGEAVFKVAILYRFSKDARKEQLPLARVELIANFLCERASLFPTEIHPDIRTIETDSINELVSLGRVDGEDNDWLLIAKPEFKIEFVSRATADLELEASLQPPQTIDRPTIFTRADIGINRSDYPVTFEPGTFALDLLLVIENADPP